MRWSSNTVRNSSSLLCATMFFRSWSGYQWWYQGQSPISSYQVLPEALILWWKEQEKVSLIEARHERQWRQKFLYLCPISFVKLSHQSCKICTLRIQIPCSMYLRRIQWIAPLVHLGKTEKTTEKVEEITWWSCRNSTPLYLNFLIYPFNSIILQEN